MRTLEEAQKELAEVEAQIKAQQEGMPNYDDPGYRAARFDYIVDGDRSGLDAYQNALNAAIQNKLSREQQENLMKITRQREDEDRMNEWQRDYSRAKSAQADAYANPKSTQLERENADTDVRYQEAKGTKKGYMEKYAEMTKAPEGEPKKEAPAPKKTWGQTRAFAYTKANSKNSTKDEVNDALKALDEYSDNDYVVTEAADARTALNNRLEAIRDEEWKTYKNDADSAIKHGLKKRAQELFDKIDDYGTHDDTTPVKDKLYAFLHPKKSPVPGWLTKNFTTDDVGADIFREAKRSKDKTYKDSYGIGGTSYDVYWRYSKDKYGNEYITATDKDGKKYKTYEFGGGNGKEAEPKKKADEPKKKAEPIVNHLLKGDIGKDRIIVGEGEDW